LGKQLENKVDKDLVVRLREELGSLKSDSQGSKVALSDAMKNIEDKVNITAKYLPTMVRSARHQMVHRNSKILVFSPSTTWKITCGWYCCLAGYQFVEGDLSQVTCAKCFRSAQRKEVEMADR